MASDEDRRFRDEIVDGPGSATARLDAVLCGSLPDDDSDRSWVLWIEAWSQTRRSPEIRDVMAELDAHEVSSIVQLLVDGQAAGEFEVSDPRATATRLTALRDGLAVDRTLLHEDAAVVDQLRQSLRFNLGLEPAAFAALL